MQKIRKLVNEIYDKNLADTITNRIGQLIETYKLKIKPSQTIPEIDEKVVL